jgi:hypothetical protein
VATILAPGMILSAKIVVVDVEQVAIMNPCYLVTGIGSPPATDQDFSDAYDINVASAVKAAMCNNATYKGILTQIVEPRPQPVSVQSVAGAGVGTNGATNAPRQTRGLISYYSSLAGRGQRGRLYVPFPSTGAIQSNGSPVAGYVTLLSNLRIAIVNTTTILVGGRSASVGLCIYHRKTHNANLVAASIARTKFATQRRSGDYGRPNTSPL